MAPLKTLGFGFLDLIFIPIWFMVSIIGLLAAYKESRNNKSFSVGVSGLAIINALLKQE